MRKTFKNNFQQQQFEEKGYLIVDAFLNSEEVENLRNWYQTNYPDSFLGFHASMHSLDFDYRRKVHQVIANIFFPKADKFLDYYRPVVGNFTVKETGPESFFDFHLDWSMLDESKARSVTIWVALEDTNAENGNLSVLEGSTHLGDTWRCSPGLQLYADSDIDYATKKYLNKVLPMKAGYAIIYDHKLFHGSPPNLSGTSRLAINLAMLPKEIPSLHYHIHLGDLTAYEVDDDFYCTCLTHSAMDMKSGAYRKLSITMPQTIAVLQKSVNNLLIKEVTNV